MRVVLRFLAGSLALGALAFWFFGGPNLGWTTTAPPEGFTRSVPAEGELQFLSPGLDFLAISWIVAGAIFGLSFCFNREKANSSLSREESGHSSRRPGQDG